MLDLLQYLIPPPNIPDLTAYLAAPPDPSSSPAKPWNNPYYPIHGRSPLRNEYRVPGGWVQECDSEASSPSTGSWRTGSEGTVVSSPATSLDDCSSDDCEDEQGEGEKEEEEVYDPEYATYLLASMLAEEEMKERRENEEIYRIRNKLSPKREWEGKTGLMLGEKLLHFKIVRHLKGFEMRLRIREEVRMERDVGRNSTLGTAGGEGHQKLKEFFKSMGKKGERDVEDDGAEIEGVERKKRRVGKVPRGI
jgi:hypothetical protein